MNVSDDKTCDLIFLKSLKAVLPEDVFEFVSSQCIFEFNSHPAKILGTSYVEKRGSKWIVRFPAFAPRKSTVLHEIAHAFLNHGTTTSTADSLEQEKQADLLASKWSGKAIRGYAWKVKSDFEMRV